MTITISFQKSPKIKADTAIVAVYSDNRLSRSAEDINKKTGGVISHALKTQSVFSGKKGQTTIVTAPQDFEYERFVLFGLGDAGDLEATDCEETGGKIFLTLKCAGVEKAVLFADDNNKLKKVDAPELAAHVAMGIKLRSYKFDKYKAKDQDDSGSEFSRLEVAGDEASAARKFYDVLGSAAEGVFFARDLVNEPPNKLYPESFAEIIKTELKPLGVEVEIFDEKKMQKLGFHSHWEVGKGSANLPRVVVMRWKGSGKKKFEPMAFVGKGITFDTGGINLKPAAGIADMKLDMGGAAAVVGLMKTLALRKAKSDVVGIVGLAENTPSHNAYRPSDVIQTMAGKTVEVLNTDAEGRLVLCDSLTYIQRKYKPKFVVDLATLTGAMMVALGTEYCGTFVNDDDLWNAMDMASKKSNEKLWRMPLDKAYRKEMDGTISDLKNLGGRYGGACTAAGFLQNFIEDDRPWAHMDIAGTAWVHADTPLCPKPATGFGVRALDRLVAAYSE